MKYFCIIILVILTTCSITGAQTVRKLIDSSRFYRNSDYKKSIFFATEAYRQATNKKQDSLIGESALVLGMGDYLSGKFDDALKCYFEAEQSFGNVKDTARLSELYAEMCVLYVKIKKFPEADEASRNAIASAAAAKDTNKLAVATNDRGLMFSDLHKNDSAIACFKKSYLLAKRMRNTLGMAYSLDYLSSILQEQGKFDQSLECLNESRQLRQGIGDKTGEAIAIENIGELYVSEKKVLEAVPFFEEAIAKAHELNYLDLETYAYNNLAQAFNTLGEYQKAYTAQQKYIGLNQKFFDQKRVQAIEELQTRYETRQKDQQNKLLAAQNKTQEIKLNRNRIAVYALIVIALLGAILFYLLYNRYKLKQQARLKEALFKEQQLRAQGIVDAEENERQRLSRELHDGVGQLLSAARRQLQLHQTSSVSEKETRETIQLLDDSIKEVRDLSHSMMPPSLLNKDLRQAVEEFVSRLGQSGKLAVSTEWVNFSGVMLDKQTTLMLYRSIQEIVANTIRHANANKIQMEFVCDATELSIMVYDDGIGFDKDALSLSGKGLGLKNIQSRIAFIGGHLHVDSSPGRGTTYIIDLKL
jgi:two-component system NarL family sensor kinase